MLRNGTRRVHLTVRKSGLLTSWSTGSFHMKTSGTCGHTLTLTTPRNFIELCVVDFKDAFCTLNSWRRMALCCGTWSHSMECCLGLTSGFLVWRRLAANATRFAQFSLVAPWWLRMQVYVGDPILIAAGSREQRLRLFIIVLPLKAALVFDLSWKGEWSGGEFSLLREEVAMQLTEAKTQAAQDNIDVNQPCCMSRN